MKLKLSPISIALLGALSTPLLAAGDDDATERYIIKYKNSNYSTMSNRVKIEGGKVKRNLARHNRVAARMSKRAMRKLQQRSDIESIEVDPKRYLLAESQPYGISMVQADQVSDGATSNMKVCIVDTGYSMGHEDLPSSGVTGNDNDGNGNDTGNWYEDGHGHGTHVAGTIAAIGNNDTGVVGVNPGGNLGLHIIKVFNNAGNWAYGSDLIAAVGQCQDAGANVISMSLGGSDSSNAERNAFDDARANGLLAIAAAGNDGNTAHSYPASYDSVMSVAAVDSSGSLASFSQRTNQVEIAAPGVNVNSTLPNNSYAAWSGTSMATPHVAGVAALVWSHYPTCSNDEIRNAMNNTAEDRGASGRDNSYGYGIVKAKAMYDSLANGCDGGSEPPPPPPTDTELTNGNAVTGISGAAGSETNFFMSVPAGATDLSFNMSGGSGDADIYVKFGSAPTTSSYDCRPYSSGNNESCPVDAQEGDYFVMVRGYSSFSGVSLVGSFDEDGTPPPPPPADISLEITKSSGWWTSYANLSWDGANTSNVDVYLDGSLLGTTANDGAARHRINFANGNYTYSVCEENTDNCSPEVTVNF